MACDVAGVGLRRDCSKLRKFPLVSLGGLKLSSTEGTGEGAGCGEGLSATTRTSAEDAACMATLQAMATLVPGTATERMPGIELWCQAATEGGPWDATDTQLQQSRRD